ncbi:TerD family protein [Prescottella subtropica]|uniref:TerD family protein n=1 Tax=Prescottella subtropica TaxID=2545757 RepID=UPI0010F846D3|nr:TerD family protein [Prescottella subtropica]
MQLTCGQNIVLPTTTLRFTATGDTALDVSALVTDTALRALSSEDFVFYNQPHTRGVRMGEGSVEIDLDAVRPDAHAVLCIASVDPLAAGSVVTTVTAALTDPAGTPVAAVDVDCRSAETAVICWELYRRSGQWKVRAVGQGYADGLAGLITHHGVDVDPGDTDPGSTSEPIPDAGTYGPIEPLDPNHIVERFTMIMEDAARSAGALIAARSFAENRLDRELTAAVADPATRNSAHTAGIRDQARRRHDTVVADADTRYRRDAAHLDTELRTIGPLLPRLFADWNAPAWTAGTPESGTADGIRIGDLSAPGCGPLRVPVCLPFPLRQPLHILGADTPATASVTAAAVLRILAADPDVVLDVVDLSGGLRPLADGFAHRGGVTITRADDIGPYLDTTAAAAELALLDRGTPHSVPPAPRLIVLDHFPYGYDPRQLPAIAFLTEHGPALGVSTVLVSDDPAAVEQIHPDLPHRSYALPVAGNDDWRDPWTSNPWTFTPDRAPADIGRVVDVLTHATRR